MPPRRVHSSRLRSPGQCSSQPVVLRQGVVKLRRDAQQPLLGLGPGNERDFDPVFLPQEILKWAFSERRSRSLNCAGARKRASRQCADEIFQKRFFSVPVGTEDFSVSQSQRAVAGHNLPPAAGQLQANETDCFRHAQGRGRIKLPPITAKFKLETRSTEKSAHGVLVVFSTEIIGVLLTSITDHFGIQTSFVGTLAVFANLSFCGIYGYKAGRQAKIKM
jgi:hypothetical protein